MEAKGAKSEGAATVLDELGRGAETSADLSSIGAGAIAAGDPGRAIKRALSAAEGSGWTGEAAGLEGSCGIGTCASFEASSSTVEVRSLVLTRTISAGRAGLAMGLLAWDAAGSDGVGAREGTGRRGTLGHAASAKGRSRLRKDSPSLDASNRFSDGFEDGAGSEVVLFATGSRFTSPTGSVAAAGGSVKDNRGDGTSSTPTGFPEALRLEDFGESDVTGRDSMRGSRSRRPAVLERGEAPGLSLELFHAASKGGAGAAVVSRSTCGGAGRSEIGGSLGGFGKDGSSCIAADWPENGSKGTLRRGVPFLAASSARICLESSPPNHLSVADRNC